MAQVKTIQRVIRKLASKGIIDFEEQPAGTLGFKYLYARLPLSCDEETFDDAQEAGHLADGPS
jgi:predicted transcriptional regulator